MTTTREVCLLRMQLILFVNFLWVCTFQDLWLYILYIHFPHTQHWVVVPFGCFYFCFGVYIKVWPLNQSLTRFDRISLNIRTNKSKRLTNKIGFTHWFLFMQSYMKNAEQVGQVNWYNVQNGCVKTLCAFAKRNSVVFFVFHVSNKIEKQSALPRLNRANF